MKGQKVLFSKGNDNWATPKKIIKKLEDEFGDLYDPCPLNANFNGLKENWKSVTFVNPPYSNITEFMEKGLKEFEKGNVKTLIFLIPARTDTKYWHKYVSKAHEIRFIKGRLKFNDGKTGATFPSVIIIWYKYLDNEIKKWRNIEQ